jgi:hypothetical protein
MSGACGRFGGEEECIQDFDGKHVGKRQLG